MKVIAICVAATLALAAGATTVHAEFKTLEQLAKDCDPKSGGKSGETFCLGYIAGAVDAMMAQRANNGASSCIPENVTLRQVADNLFRFVVNNSNRGAAEGWADATAATFVIIASGKTWCPTDSDYSKGLR